MYGHYLVETGIDHPDRDLVLASVPSDAGDIFYRMTEAPCPAPVYFFKNMASSRTWHTTLSGSTGPSVTT